MQRDGSAHVGEDITYSFDGFYHGVYRDIPLRGDQAISTDSVNVSVDGLQAQPDISCFVGSTYAPDGTSPSSRCPAARGSSSAARPTARTSPTTSRYVVKNATTSYPNGTDVEYVAWGPSWTVPADNVTATLTLPEADGVKAWANPVWQARP